MGSFANTVFSVLLGWLQGLIAMIWSALTAEGGDSFLQFIAKNWIYITVFLCAVGVIADFVVYLFRWEPYKVWKSYWRRIRSRKERKEAEAAQAAEQAEAAADPSSRRRYFRPAAGTAEAPEPTEEAVYGEAYDEEEAYGEIPEESYPTGETPEEEYPAGEYPAEEYPAEADDLYRWREQPREEEEIPEEVTRAGYRVPADSPYRRPENRDKTTNRRRRIRLNLLGDSGEEEFHYVAPEPSVDQRNAYAAPVYPNNWNGEREDGEQDS